MSNKINTVIYIGITDNIQKRVWQHKNKIVEGFTKKYNIIKLVFFEEFSTPIEAIASEKKIKGWMRWKKVELIQVKNPNWSDLSLEWDSSPA